MDVSLLAFIPNANALLFCDSAYRRNSESSLLKHRVLARLPCNFMCLSCVRLAQAPKGTHAIITMSYTGNVWGCNKASAPDAVSLNMNVSHEAPLGDVSYDLLRDSVLFVWT